MFARWLPWKFIVKRAAKRFGIIDPIQLAARVRRFSQPSEVQEPIELLRAGIIFHARGLINTKAIQYNLDWVWPFWVQKQFNPGDPSFIPRGFAFSHVNITHRNWTAVGHPDLPVYPVMDPRGLVTPLYDGWSLDCWIIDAQGEKLLPCMRNDVVQHLDGRDGLKIVNRCDTEGIALNTELSMDVENNSAYAVISSHGRAENGGWLVVALRPYNPEGIQFIESIEFQDHARPFWLVNRHTRIYMDRPPEKVVFSSYSEGDVIEKWRDPQSVKNVKCSVGMATSAAFFPLPTNDEQHIRISVDLEKDMPSRSTRRKTPVNTWEGVLGETAQMQVPDEKFRFLYDTAVRTLIMLSAHDPVPGPYTYRRFWFRDACLMLNSMMAANMLERSRNCIDRFPARQKMNGYFRSQEGEWDSNGQVLWIMHRYLELTGNKPSAGWLESALKAAEWIEKKRTPKRPAVRHAGLLPAGFSAEHLGPNDYYYWDDFWGLAGLAAATVMARRYHSATLGEKLNKEYEDFSKCIFSSISAVPEWKSRGAIPASPYRRMDAGAVGSLVADYPLQLTPAGDPKIMNTVEFLMDQCFYEGAFFQDMIHSGINAYLTLDIAQSLLRAGDPRYQTLIRNVADLASPTGQWPEAIHPHTKGGCMGDGQHGWAAAEWVLMMRSLFVREEENALVIGSGVFPQWLSGSEPLGFGPTPTPYGPVTVNITPKDGFALVEVSCNWRVRSPEIRVSLPGFSQAVRDAGQDHTHFQMEVYEK
ncbi:MAG: hypothetical protein K9J79_04510 [Desulfobacteraceae bacterium]|nr:hypothetical protein [Desulfobacteraceae bacterium]MCF8094603.1 hypothetical protein [Desulfobacteraceae bacterium]